MFRQAFFVLEHGLTVMLVACPCALGALAAGSAFRVLRVWSLE